jgi:glutamine synthetase
MTEHAGPALARPGLESADARVRAPAETEMVMVAFPDVNGSLRGKALSAAAFERAVERGLPMTDLILGLDPLDVPISDYDQLGIRSGAADLVLHPEVDTLGSLSWQPGWRLCLATPRFVDGRRCAYASREVARAALEGLAGLGLEVLAALEYEVRVRDASGAPLSSGVSYSLGEIGRFEALVRALAPALDALGVELAAVHTEAGPGLLELNLGARRGLRAADDAALVKFATKAVAASIGLRASFLAKPAAGEEGSSGHLHLSLWREGHNVLASAPGEPATGELSHALGGLLAHLAGASLLYNPTLNSYKRLVPGYFAPVNASWGVDNRSAALRVIVGSRPEESRIECRRPGADANPYLVLAAAAASVLDGMRRSLEPPGPVEGDAYARSDLASLPASLESALAAFRADATLREVLGEDFCRYFEVSREWELKAFQQTVTAWERERYEGAC